MNLLKRFDSTGFRDWLAGRRARGFPIPEGVEEAVGKIIADVRQRGDQALLEYTERFDGIRLSPQDLLVRGREFGEAANSLDVDLFAALRTARDRIESFHRHQQAQGYQIKDHYGNVMGRVIRPLERVGVYIPGGRAAYPSSVLMCAIPARIAGVKEVIICTPPGRDGKVHPAVIAAAGLAGVTLIYRVGGAQAVAAMAYGTETIPKVNKIVGPGNIYVTVAKKMVYGAVDIDGLHGPSEVAIIADDKAPPAWVAVDLLAQAEHDPLAMAVLLTPAAGLIESVEQELESQLVRSDRRGVAEASLRENGAAVEVKTLEEALELANLMAAEHLELMVRDPLPLLDQVENAGAVFLGYHSPVAMGDYSAGTNHVLPTGGSARYFSGLGVEDFVRRVDYFMGAEFGIEEWGRPAALIADAEGLSGHAQSIRYRMTRRRGRG